jgi:hypothetical protein
MPQTPMAEFVIDPEQWWVPGTENPEAGIDEHPGQVRRGVLENSPGSPANTVGAFDLRDSTGETVMTGEYCRPELREPLFMALRDLLDLVDPLPATNG